MDQNAIGESSSTSLRVVRRSWISIKSDAPRPPKRLSHQSRLGDDKPARFGQPLDNAEIDAEVVGEQPRRIRGKPRGDRYLLIIRTVEGDENLRFFVADLFDVVAEAAVDEGDLSGPEFVLPVLAVCAEDADFGAP